MCVRACISREAVVDYAGAGSGGPVCQSPEPFFTPSPSLLISTGPARV